MCSNVCWCESFAFFSGSDSASDTEVSYADIMITVRGVSTPELNQVVYLSPGDQNQVRCRFKSQCRAVLITSLIIGLGKDGTV